MVLKNWTGKKVDVPLAQVPKSANVIGSHLVKSVKETDDECTSGSVSVEQTKDYFLLEMRRYHKTEIELFTISPPRSVDLVAIETFDSNGWLIILYPFIFSSGKAPKYL